MVAPEVTSVMKYPKRSQYKHAKQKKYRIRNWTEYYGTLRRRGDVTIWFSEKAISISSRGETHSVQAILIGQNHEVDIRRRWFHLRLGACDGA